MDRQHQLDRLSEMERQSKLGGGEARVERQHERGKLTARERFELLFDPGTFVEIDKFVVPEEPLPERPSSSSGFLRRAGNAVISTGTALASEIIRDPENRTRVARWLIRRTIG